MPIQPPNLDDITFADLRKLGLDHAREQMQAEWTDLSPGDPGVLLLEMFAYLTEQLVYRLNRVPEKVYVSLLRLLGVSLYPPVAATVRLVFRNPTDTEIVVPAFTQVTTSRRGPEEPLFTTVREITVPAQSGGEDGAPGQADVLARHCDFYADERLGTGNDAPGLRLRVAHPPILAPMRDQLALRIETVVDDERVEWRPAANFSGKQLDSRVYTVDRLDGVIRFAPALQLSQEQGSFDEDEGNTELPPDENGDDQEPVSAAVNDDDEATTHTRLETRARPLAAVPGRDVPIFISYATGGGANGNVAAETLTTIVPDSRYPELLRLEVDNPEPATGGQDAESFANALARAPQEIYSLERAITARDYERLATAAGNGIARASAQAAAQRWRHGRPGTIEMHLLPVLTEADKSVEQVTAERRASGDDVWEFTNLQAVLADSKPLGTSVDLQWVNFKPIAVHADIVFKERHSRTKACQRIEAALDQLLQPLSGEADRPGWPFGQTLYASDAFNVILGDEAVDRVSRLTLCVAEAPDSDVTALAADSFQEHLWYVAAGRQLFRSFNDGDGWELVPAFPPPAPDTVEQITLIESSPHRPGLVAVWVEQLDTDGRFLRSLPYLSTDCGESWHLLQAFEEGKVEDIAWIMRADVPIMLLATNSGLYKLEVTLTPNTPPAGTLTGVPDMSGPLYAVAAIEKDRQLYVAVALKSRGGVYLTNGLFLAYDIDLEWAKTTLDTIGAEEPEIEPLPPVEPGDEAPTAADDDSIFKPLANRDSDVTLEGADIRTLAVHYDKRDGRVYLWAGAMATGWSKDGQRVSGIGAFRWEVETIQPLRSQWEFFPDWTGGSCRTIDFAASTVLAASQWGGVLRLNLDDETPAWRQTSSVDLPRRQPRWPNDAQRNFEALPSLATSNSWETPLAIVGGTQGIYLSRDRGERFALSSKRCYEHAVTLPPNWLFSPGNHQVCPPAGDEAGD